MLVRLKSLLVVAFVVMEFVFELNTMQTSEVARWLLSPKRRL